MRWSAISKSSAGFTLIEIVVSLGILIIFFGLSFGSLSAMHQTSLIRGSGDSVASAISTAALKARAGDQGTPWGVYFDYDNVTRAPVRVLVFSGATYATRNATYDIEYPLGVMPVFTSVALQGAGVSGGSDHEVVFAALTGTTTQYGSLVLTTQNRVSTVTISALGIPTRQ
jgi:Tfp pilus assembly protein FimT